MGEDQREVGDLPQKGLIIAVGTETGMDQERLAEGGEETGHGCELLRRIPVPEGMGLRPHETGFVLPPLHFPDRVAPPAGVDENPAGKSLRAVPYGCEDGIVVGIKFDPGKHRAGV